MTKSAPPVKRAAGATRVAGVTRTAGATRAAGVTRAATTTRPPAAAKRVARARKPRKLDSEGLLALLEQEAGGLSAASIAERANASYNQVLELLRDRERAGDVRRSGSRRSTTWRVITDEERIAARAAELAARA
jgi:hypothetical protein